MKQFGYYFACLLLCLLLHALQVQSDTNTVTPQVISITNNAVTFNGTMIGHLAGGTNFVPVPDVSALSASFENGFAVGVRYGAIASRRNPDVNDAGGLMAIARGLMQQEQAQQAAQQQRTRGK